MFSSALPTGPRQLLSYTLFFCFCFIAADLRFESSGSEDLDKLLVNTLFEVFVCQLQINEFFLGLIFFNVLLSSSVSRLSMLRAKLVRLFYF